MEIKNAADVQKFARETEERLEGVEYDLDAVKKNLKNKSFIDVENNGWTDDKAAQFGEMFKDLARYPGQDIPQEVMEKHGLGFVTEKAALGTNLTADAATGSYVTAVGYWPDISAVINEDSMLYGKVTKINMTTRTMIVPTKADGVEFSYVSTDGDALTESDPTFGTETMTAYVYALWFPMTESLLEDDNVNLGNYFRKIIGEAFAAKFDAEFLTGTGAPTTGLMADTSVNVHTLSGSGIDDLEVADLISCMTLLDTRAKRKRCSWVMHTTIMDHLRGLQDANGQFYFPDLRSGMTNKLLGYDVVLSDQMPAYSDSAADLDFIGFGDMSELYYGDRVPLEVKMLPGTARNVDYDQVFLKARFRASFLIPQPGSFARITTAS